MKKIYTASLLAGISGYLLGSLSKKKTLKSKEPKIRLEKVLSIKGHGLYECVDNSDTTLLNGSFKFTFPSHKKTEEIYGEFIRTELNTPDEIPFFPWRFIGESENGEPLIASGLALSSYKENLENFSKVNLGFSYNELQIGEPSNFTSLSFFVPDIKIEFDRMEKIGKRLIRNHSNFVLTYKESNYKIEFKNINRTLNTMEKNILESNFPLKITLTKDNQLIDFEDAKTVLDYVLELISLAYGSRVLWRYVIGYKNDVECFRFFRNTKHSNVSSFRNLISIDRPGMFTQFITSTFPSYIQLSKDYHLSLIKLIDGLHFSSERLTFPMPIVTLSSSIEEFANEVLNERVTHYTDKSTRKNLYPLFNKWIDQNVIPLLSEIDKQDFGEGSSKQKLSALLQRNLRSRITFLFDQYNIQYDDTVVRNFVKKRNNAAHGTYKFENADFLLWSTMVSYLEQLILKTINYNGHYLDWSTSPPEDKRIED
ncbi:hypothetical protein ACH0BF_08955 [Pseudobacillus sp. 179-B 2D1 NHS]|uniref:hypothetical protein n=1 Tax=Pseudobacillus sp. 179-B 2D1 NHS TaxID=3374292 RepID=UPI003879F2B4